MATTFPASIQVQRASRQLQTVLPRQERTYAVSLITGLTCLAFVVQGYHPFAEDGGLYAAGVERLLDPTLFPTWAQFVQAPMRVSLFAPVIAAAVRLSHLSLPTVLALLHLSCIFSTLLGGWMIAQQCWASRQARTGAVTLLACWLTLPVAGTSLQLMDPYLTPRSFATVCMMLALAGVLRLTNHNPSEPRALPFALFAGSLFVAVLMHPLMAGYTVAACCVLATLRSAARVTRTIGTASVCLSALALSLAVHAAAPPETAAYVHAALTRTYWFPAEWAWYEGVGLVAPMVIVAIPAVTRLWSATRWRAVSSDAERALAGMALLCGTTAVAVAVVFARTYSSEHLVARLQPLRIFQIVYFVMVLLLGAHLGELVLRRKAWEWCVAIALLCGVMFTAERATYPNSGHLEMSDIIGRNPWVQAFVWVRTHTPKHAMFALEPDYIHSPAADGHCFRAIAQRSALPDYSKDGGETSIAPDLAPAWEIGQALQRPLAGEMNESSLNGLRRAGVSWIVVRSGTHVHLNCPFTNSAVRICRLN